MTPAAHLYFHSPCLDGIASAVLLSDYLETTFGTEITLHIVNYDLRDSWVISELAQPANVVDFLYHPRAEYWADHHHTSFLNEALRDHFEQRNDARVVYDQNSPSCARLLWRHLQDAFGYRNHHYQELVRWATVTDSAQYASVQEAIRPTASALQINLALAADHDGEQSKRLVRAFQRHTIEEVAALPEIRQRYTAVQSLLDTGLERFKGAAHADDNGYVVFDVDSTDAIISRYAPFHFYPHARYSIGIVRDNNVAKIRAMRNPWRDFKSVQLGTLFQHYGGGGHTRVASLVLRPPRAHQAPKILHQLVAKIQDADCELQKVRCS